MPIRGLRVQKYTPNMAMFGDFDQTEAHFSCTLLPIHVTTVSDLTLFIIQDVIEGKNSFSMVKWVKHGPLTLCLR